MEEKAKVDSKSRMVIQKGVWRKTAVERGSKLAVRVHDRFNGNGKLPKKRLVPAPASEPLRLKEFV